MDWGTLGTILAMFGSFTGMVFWRMSRIEGRMDIMGARIDSTMCMILDIQKEVCEMQREIKDLYKAPPRTG